MTDPTLAFIPLTRAEFDGLRERLERTSESDWRRPTVCEGWNVGDVVAHISMGAEFQVQAIRRGYAGDTSPLFSSPEQRSSVFEARRGRPRAELFNEWTFTTASLLELFDTLCAADLDERRAWHQTGVHPLRWFVEQRLGETAIHRVDIQRGLGDDYEMTDAAATRLYRNYVDRLPRLVRPNAPKGARGLVQIEVLGESPQSFLLNLADGRAEFIGAGDAIQPHLTITSSPAIIIELTTGRLSLDDGVRNGRLTATGDQSLVSDWGRVFRPL